MLRFLKKTSFTLLILFSFVLFSYADTETSRPDGNVDTNWNMNTYTNIDDNVTQPTAGDGSYVRWNKDDDGETQSWTMDDTSFNEITQLVLWLYVGATMDDETLCRINIGAGSSSDLSVDIGDENTWASVTWSSTWTQSEVNSMTVQCDAPASVGGGKLGEIDVIYIDITGTSTQSRTLIID